MAASLSATVQDVLVDGGAPALGGLVLAENVFPPIPSEAILPLAGFLVAQGRLGAVAALFAATAGSLAGALLLYALGRRGGRPLILRYGRHVRLRERDLRRAETLFERWGAAAVLLGRLVPGVRSLISVPAGLADMPLGRFTACTAIGSAIWNAALIGGGWALAARYEALANRVGTASTVVLVALAVLAVAAAALAWRRRMLRRDRSRVSEGR